MKYFEKSNPDFIFLQNRPALCEVLQKLHQAENNCRQQYFVSLPAVFVCKPQSPLFLLKSNIVKYLLFLAVSDQYLILILDQDSTNPA